MTETPKVTRLLLAVVSATAVFAVAAMIIGWVYLVHYASGGEMWGLAIALVPAFIGAVVLAYRHLD